MRRAPRSVLLGPLLLAAFVYGPGQPSGASAASTAQVVAAPSFTRLCSSIRNERKRIRCISNKATDRLFRHHLFDRNDHQRDRHRPRRDRN